MGSSWIAAGDGYAVAALAEQIGDATAKKPEPARDQRPHSASLDRLSSDVKRRR
jgi:hypothetical protein